MAIAYGDDAIEMLDWLRTRLEIPQNVREVTIRIAFNEAVWIDCKYSPDYKPEAQDAGKVTT